MEFEKDIGKECYEEKLEGVCAPIEIFNKLKSSVINVDDSLATAPPKKILEYLKNKYKCLDEVCVLKQELDSDEINRVIKENFKPVGPVGPKKTEWLSNFDIDDVLKQIAVKHEKFLHLYFQMIDFAKTNADLARLDFAKEYENGYRTFGTVINTDPSTKNGSHWFCVFGDFRTEPYQIEYFNSSGELPKTEINIWMKSTKQVWSKAMEKPIKDVVVSRIQHQKDGYSCGIYSLYYIISRLEGVSSDYFAKNRVPDIKMHAFREYLFRL
jgi:Ulp1 family protease